MPDRSAPAPVSPSAPRPPRRLWLALLAALGVLASIAGVAQLVRTWQAERRLADAMGAAGAGCYYDGRPQADCPVPRTGPRADTAWVRAAVLDTLYARAAGHFGPPPSVALAGRLIAPGDPAAPWATLAGPGVVDTASLAARLTTAAPALAPATARALAAAALAARPGPADTLGPLWTVEGKQRRYDSAATARVLAGRPASKQEALQTRGLLAFGALAVSADRAWALAWAARAVTSGTIDAPAEVERSWVLLARLPDGRWRAVRVLGAGPSAG